MGNTDTTNSEPGMLIAIFTMPRYDEWLIALEIIKTSGRGSALLWDESSERLTAGKPELPSVIYFEVGSDRLALANQRAPGLGPENRLRPSDKLAAKLLEKMNREENYLVVHDVKKYLDDRHAFATKVDALANFHHMPAFEEFYDQLVKLLDAIKCNQGEAIKASYSDLHAEIVRLVKAQTQTSVAAQMQLKKVSVLKHKVAGCFLTTDIDLQGWQETGFNAQYGKEISEAHAGNPSRPIERAREHLYEGDYSLSQVIGVRSQEINSIESSIKRLLPEDELARADQLFLTADDVLNHLSMGSMDKLRDTLETGNPFHDWFAALMKALDDLREAIGKASSV